MINLPTDTLYKFFALLGVAVLSGAIAHLVLVDDKRSTAQTTALAARVEHSELLKQTVETKRRAVAMLEDATKRFEVSTSLANAGKLNEAKAQIAGAQAMFSSGEELGKRGEELLAESQKKEVEAARLGAIADAVNADAALQKMRDLVIMVVGCIFFCGGVFAWARATKPQIVPIANPPENS